MHRLTELQKMSRAEQVKDFLHTYTELAKVAKDREFFIDALRSGDPSLPVKLERCFERYVNPIGKDKVYAYAPCKALTNAEKDFLLAELKKEFL
ncbi:MAG: hypothetical protein H6573_34275 [Lewinellaceae bacterium]|nr:hypothetical protein [Lewinellaceae bacterium]